MRLINLLAGCGLALVVLVACDPGSDISFDRDGSQCRVKMKRNSDGFRVDMTLTCKEDSTDCYTVESLSCQGEDKSDAVPIDLTDDGCPGEAYCVESCDDGLDAPGNLWDMPSLQAVDGCNVYEDAS